MLAGIGRNMGEGIGVSFEDAMTAVSRDMQNAVPTNFDLNYRGLSGQGSADAYARRQLFLKIFSPKLNGTLVYRDRQIACVVEEAGFAVSTRQRIPNFFVSLLCPSPFFETLDEVREELASWIPLFEFELEIPESGMEFGMRQPSQIITVKNIGDVSCGCKIVFQALGTVTNPELLNIDTSEYIRLLTTMNAGDELRVYTHFAGKRVVSVKSDGHSDRAILLLRESLTGGINMEKSGFFNSFGRRQNL